MNAYEVAKELSKFMTEDEYTDLDKAIFMASNMLRQQADRIAELEEENKRIRERTWDSDSARQFLKEIAEAKVSRGEE